MRLAAASDIHTPANLEQFRNQLHNTEQFQTLILAGDVVNDNQIEQYCNVLDEVQKETDIYAVFGNEEYEEQHDQYVETYGDRVHFLRETTAELEDLQIIGTTGSLDRPTWWQRKNKPERWKIYADRVKTVDRLLDECDRAILLTHYAPTYRTLKGENSDAWPEMGRQEYEDIIEKHSDTLIAAVHGHAHRGAKRAEIAEVPVINAAVTLDREKLPTIET